MKITFITPNKMKEFHKKTIILKEMQKFVGGYIEIIHLPKNKIMVVNEEGLLKKLPLNITAANIAERQIVGNVIVMSEKDMKT